MGIAIGHILSCCITPWKDVWVFTNALYHCEQYRRQWSGYLEENWDITLGSHVTILM